MPGSPPHNITDPGTIPPPKTRSISGNSKFIRSLLFEFISDILSGFFKSDFELKNVLGFVILISLSSCILFHSLHCKHFPTHLELIFPQLLQTNFVFFIFFATIILPQNNKT